MVDLLNSVVLVYGCAQDTKAKVPVPRHLPRSIIHGSRVPGTWMDAQGLRAVHQSCDTEYYVISTDHMIYDK